MKRTEIPAVKVEGYVTEGELEDHYYPFRRGTTIPCILRTAAADKLILDVVRAAIALAKSAEDPISAECSRLLHEVNALEKAGVKL